MAFVNKIEFMKYSSQVKVLYVEDSVVQSKLTQRMVASFFEVFDTACNGLEGLEKYKSGKYDILITDVNMPIMDGITLITKIREINKNQNIVVTSSVDDKDTLIDYINLGVGSFVLKPLSEEKIKIALFKMCQQIDIEKKYEELKQKELLNTFVVTANHEMNQDLSIIMGNTELSLKLDEVKNNPTLVKFLSKIKNSSKKMADILTKFRELDKIDFIDYLPNTKMIDLHKEDDMKERTN
ncbi:MAG: response regulator [Candidatus Delongbacteria bacterium]|nr:response regulator [Candidatus Delongbacteria bacterium]MBN2835642.1 response regulator [Candidatus Delongbacteria bacterium]